MFSFEVFTKVAFSVFKVSQKEARLCGRDFMDVEHLLLGLTKVEQGIAYDSLIELNVTYDRVREELKNIVADGSDGHAVEIEFTPRTKQIFELAWKQAQALGHSFVGSEHILIGLSLEPAEVATEILEKLNVETDEVRRRVLTKMFEKYPLSVDSRNAQSFGAPARILVLLERYSEAHDLLSRAVALPGGESFHADLEKVKRHL